MFCKRGLLSIYSRRGPLKYSMLVDVIKKISKLVVFVNYMEIFIKREIISCSTIDTNEIVKAINQVDIINNSLQKISKMMYEKDEVKTLNVLIKDMEQ